MNTSRLIGALCTCLSTPLARIANAVTKTFADQPVNLATLFGPTSALDIDDVAAGFLFHCEAQLGESPLPKTSVAHRYYA